MDLVITEVPSDLYETPTPLSTASECFKINLTENLDEGFFHRRGGQGLQRYQGSSVTKKPKWKSEANVVLIDRPL